MFIAKFVPGFVTMLPASPLTYSSLFESYVIVISAVLIPLDGTFAKYTGTTTVPPFSHDAESTLTVNPLPTTGVFAGVCTVCVFVGTTTGVGSTVPTDDELTVNTVGAVLVPVYEILNPTDTDPPAGILAL